MTQRSALIMFLTGTITFLGSLAEFFTSHETWVSMTTPQDIAHVLFMIVTFLMTISGALSYQLPRDSTKYTDGNDERKQ
jgi:uncharacterized membrane protein YgdD (TMEM256/DUF423 family)